MRRLSLKIRACASALSPVLAGSLLLSMATHARAENMQALDEAEALLLRQHPELARREGERLILNTSPGRSLRLSSKTACTGPEDCELYHFGGLSADGGFLVVRLHQWEGGSVHWISRRDGRRYEVYADPALSPDGRHIVAAVPNEAYGVNGVFVWEIGHGTLVKRFSETPRTYALYDFLAWLDAQTVRLKRTAHAPDHCGKDGLAEAEVRLRRLADGRWKIQPPEPGSLRCL